MKKYPEQLIILGIPYDTSFPEEITNSAGERQSGACVPLTGNIYCQKDIIDLQREITLWHEVLHAITVEVAPTVYHDENIISGLALGVHSVVVNNEPWWKRAK
jgi:hypothetical protein